MMECLSWGNFEIFDRKMIHTDRILADVVVVESHVEAHTMIYKSSLLCIFWIQGTGWSVLIAQILHYCNTFA